MEEPAVEHGVELIAKRVQRKGIADEEASGHTALVRLGIGEADRARRDVDSSGVQPELGSHQHVLARATADVEDAPGEARRTAARAAKPGCGRPMSHGGVLA